MYGSLHARPEMIRAGMTYPARKYSSDVGNPQSPRPKPPECISCSSHPWDVLWPFQQGGTEVRDLSRSPRFPAAAVALVFCAAAFVSPTMAAKSGSRIPDLSGQWGRDMLFFEPPASGFVLS